MACTRVRVRRGRAGERSQSTVSARYDELLIIMSAAIQPSPVGPAIFRAYAIRREDALDKFQDHDVCVRACVRWGDYAPQPDPCVSPASSSFSLAWRTREPGKLHS